MAGEGNTCSVHPKRTDCQSEAEPYIYYLIDMVVLILVLIFSLTDFYGAYTSGASLLRAGFDVVLALLWKYIYLIYYLVKTFV